jgi:hypothetical protein
MKTTERGTPSQAPHRSALESVDAATAVRRTALGLQPTTSDSEIERAAVFVVAVPPEELKGLALDHVGGFLLSLMDGATDVESILDISNLPRPITRRHLHSLHERGIIVLRLGGGMPVAPGPCGDPGVAPGEDVPLSSGDSPVLRRI